jgi:molybdenum cofactor biosynthesis enzyme MoaA
MPDFKLENQYAYKLKSLPRGKDLTTPILHSCNIPYKTLVIDYNSNCLLCFCDGFLPVPVGKVKDFNSLEEVFNSPIAKILQEDVSNKKFTWCAVDHCGIKNKNITITKYELSINIDESCNLYCPSCRREQIMHTSGPEVENKKQDLEKIAMWLEKFNEPINIILSGNGDPLASHVIRPFFNTYKPKKTQTFRLFTNGLLIKKQLEKSFIFPNITSFFISVDAGSKEVYENVRRGGNWEILNENFDFLVSSNKNHLVRLNFALQKNNYKDLYNFVELCRKYNFAGQIHQLDDWGTWNYSTVKNPDSWTILNGTYLDNAVLRPTHPDHQECLKILHNISKQKNSFIYFSPIIEELIND